MPILKQHYLHLLWRNSTKTWQPWPCPIRIILRAFESLQDGWDCRDFNKARVNSLNIIVPKINQKIPPWTVYCCFRTLGKLNDQAPLGNGTHIPYSLVWASQQTAAETSLRPEEHSSHLWPNRWVPSRNQSWITSIPGRGDSDKITYEIWVF